MDVHGFFPFTPFREFTFKEEKEVSKLAKRILLIAAATLLVLSLSVLGFADGAGEANGPVCYKDGDVNGDGTINNKDAIYTLYNYMLGDERFPMNQDADFNNDGVLNNKDAVYVLYAYMDNPNYPLNGTIHHYYDPIWSWSDANGTMTALVNFKCGCGIPATYTVASGVTVSVQDEKEATCVDAGFIEYLASISLGNRIYTNEKTVTIPAGDGHNLVGTTGCETARSCTLCDYEETPLGHNWEKGTYTAATCTADAVQAYTCSGCGATKNVAETGTAGHVLTYKGDAKVSGCQYVKQYTCSGCGQTINGTAPEDTFYIHSYAATLTEATCVTEGKKTYSCSACGAESDKVETVPVNGAHNWVKDGEEKGVTSYHCDRAGCTATKTTVSMDNNDQDGISKQALQSAQELQLSENTSVSLDEEAQKALDADRNIKITVDKVPVADLDLNKDLTEEQKQQIGNNPVFDFNMIYTDNQQKVSNFGENAVVTVSLPYTLQAGDDVDAIDVWFIADDGTLTLVKGTYANGCVTFTTNHFSYYTVIRLTAAQRCERYGHIDITTTKAATCTEDGYTVTTCQRCGIERSKEVAPKFGHSFTSKTTQPTCDQVGSKVSTCSTCNHTVTTEIPALGHNLKVDSSKTVVASCTQAGQEVFVCTNNGCDHQQINATPQLAHNYKDHEVKAATCTEKGYTTQKCATCDSVITVNETAPLGHEYLNAQWSWTEDYTASLTLTCSHDRNHTVKLNAVVSRESKDGGCTGAGSITYTATVSYNGSVYTDTRTKDIPVVGHKPQSQWTTTATQHYHACSVCGEPLDAADHQWDEGTVTKEATCKEAGSIKYTCTVCDYEKPTTIPATKDHNYVDGVCSVCGDKEGECRHIALTRTLVDLESKGVCEGAEVYFVTCQCGENQYYDIDTLGCTFGPAEEITVETPTINAEGERSTCTQCGLTCTSYEYIYINTDPCGIENRRVAIYEKGGTELFVNDQCKYMEEHGTDVFYDSIDLSDYGLCGEELMIYTCPCEERTNTMISTMARKCQWVNDPEGSSKFVESYICSVCGARRTEEYLRLESEYECQYVYGFRYTYYFGGEQIYTYDNIHISNQHYYRPTDAEVLGDHCEDGVIVTYTCQGCKDTQERCVFYHVSIPLETVDTKESSICYDAILQIGCPCGEETHGWSYEGDNSCDWMYLSYQGNTYLYECDICHATREDTVIVGEKDEHCNMMRTVTSVFKDSNGAVLATTQEHGTTTSHLMTQTFNLLGNICTDGVEITHTCTNCDYRYTYTTYTHDLQYLAHYDLSDYDCCYDEIYVYSCPCGSFNNLYWDGIDSCSWQYIGGTMTSSMYRCPTCGIQRTISYTDAPAWNACNKNRTYTVTLSRGEETLLTFQYKVLASNHKTVATYTLNPGATNCDGGYTVTERCINCDYTYTSSDWGHMNYTVAWQPIQQDGLCSDVYVATSACACGEIHSKYLEWEGEPCIFQNPTFDPAYGGMVSTCATCGSKHVVTNRTEASQDVPCRIDQIRSYIFLSAEGTELFRYEEVNSNFQHTDVYSYRSTGSTTCEGGYLLIRTCTLCGDTSQEETSGCTPRPAERITLAQLEGLCGTTELIHEQCFCGKNDHWSIYDPCNWTITGQNQLTCMNCGAVREQIVQKTQTPGTCQAVASLDYTTTLNGKTYSKQYSYTTTDHTLVYTFRIAEGNTCEDGYYVDSHCIYCDYSDVGTQMQVNAYHQMYPVEIYEFAAYGMCDGNYTIRRCACGQEIEGDTLYYGSCNKQYTGNTDPDTGADESYCPDCQCFFYFNYEDSSQRKACSKSFSAYMKIVKDEEIKLEKNFHHTVTSHDYAITGASFRNSGSSCVDGVDLTLKCLVCNATATRYVGYHEAHTVEYVDLADLGGCGGYFHSYSCACGESKGLNYMIGCQGTSATESTTTDDQGREHNIYTRNCSKCGLAYRRDRYYTAVEAPCQAQSHETHTVSLNGTTKTFDTVYTFEHHWETEPSYPAPVTPESCGNGLHYDTVCKVCKQRVGAVSLGSHSPVNVIKTFDLSQYGSVCGGKVELSTCTCGERTSWNFSDDTKCSLPPAPGCDFWITDALPDSWQESVDGGQGYYREAHSHFCAVTDPQCNMKIRSADYWVATGNCTAKRKITLQLGYDPATGTCKEEYSFFTGETATYHTYEVKQGDGKLEDGTTYYSELYTCTACGSTRDYKLYHKPDSNNWWKCENIFINTLDNGSYKNLTVTETKDILHNECRFLSEVRREYTTAEGVEMVELYEYTWDFENDCTRTEVYTDAAGNKTTVTFTDMHQFSWHHNVVKEPTCSQSGIQEDRELCDGCGKESLSDDHILAPTCHNFQYNSEKETYVCTSCGLESKNGSNGAIILEDLTATHGTETQTVIGYYNPDNHAYNIYLSVVMENPADDKDEIVLTFNDFAYLTAESNGITAVGFNTAAAQAAAIQAIGDYEGGYALRLTFVTTDNTSDLDYAITFDSLVAE